MHGLYVCSMGAAVKSRWRLFLTQVYIESDIKRLEQGNQRQKRLDWPYR